MTKPDQKLPGAVLRAEREALGVTVREVAETLNLSITMIEAIETDDIERLPGPVFARGYVRAYARLLELDPRPLLEHYPKAQDAEPVPEESSEPPIWEWIRRRPAIVLGGAGGALLVLLVLAVVLLWPSSGDGDAAADGVVNTPAADSESAAGRPPAAADPEVTSQIADAATAAPGSWSAPSSATATGAEPGIEDAATVTAPVDAPAAVNGALAGGAAMDAGAASNGDGARRITGSGEDRLTFAFSDDCWVEIRNATGARLYSDLSRAGSDLELVGEGPFRILLGYAPGARLTFNGEPVPLAPHTRNNVATLVLGQ